MLADLTREAVTTRLSLGGLSEEAVGDYVEAELDAPPELLTDTRYFFVVMLGKSLSYVRPPRSLGSGNACHPQAHKQTGPGGQCPIHTTFSTI